MSSKPRKFAPITAEELNAKMEKAFSKDGNGIDPYVMREKLGKDLKVEFDFENFEESPTHFPELRGVAGVVTLSNGMTCCGMAAGGDWEHPVYFVIYWDGKKLRAYVPTEGNPWNHTTKTAYGNDEEADLKDAKKRWPDVYADIEDPDDIEIASECCFEGELILADILARFESV